MASKSRKVVFYSLQTAAFQLTSNNMHLVHLNVSEEAGKWKYTSP